MAHLACQRPGEAQELLQQHLSMARTAGDLAMRKMGRLIQHVHGGHHIFDDIHPILFLSGWFEYHDENDNLFTVQIISQRFTHHDRIDFTRFHTIYQSYRVHTYLTHIFMSILSFNKCIFSRPRRGPASSAHCLVECGAGTGRGQEGQNAGGRRWGHGFPRLAAG